MNGRLKLFVSKRVSIAFGLALAILLVNVILSYQNTLKLIQANNSVAHTLEMLSQIEGLLSGLADAETGQRGYILSGDLSYLEPYNTAVMAIPRNLQQLKQLTADNPNQQQRLQILTPTIETRLAGLSQIIEARRTQGFAVAREALLIGPGKQTMDNIRQIIAEMEREENNLLVQRTEAARVSGQITLITFSVAAFAAMGLIFWVYFLLNRDLAERQRAAEALQVSQAQLAGLVASTMDAIITIDTEQRVIVFNAAAEQMFGCQAVEVKGQPIDRFIPSQFRQAHRNHIHSFGRTMISNRSMGALGTIIGLRADGREFPIEASISQFEAAGQKLYTVILRDISLRLQAEEQLRAANQELIRSNAELQQFAYVASHDLQEPLRMVASYTQLLARRYQDQLDADADEFIAFAVDGASRMQQLINDLLSYSRVNTRAKIPEPTDAGAVLGKVLVNLQAAVAESGAVVTHDPLPTLPADETQLIQLFQNLIGNALKFHSARPPCVHVSAARQGQEWIFSVQDNGIGIEPQYAERIFVIFQRLHSQADYPGTGIGLAICKRIVERHGGRIWFESQPDKGTTFYFNLPIDKVKHYE